jgi:formylglycine-generating enzyme required for sulfatase activity/tRNA A-37 threonylcarbamoyl transferase component Bud32
LEETPADETPPANDLNDVTRTMRRIGPYQVFEEIGRGGSGIVYRAYDGTIGRDLAIKELSLARLAPDEIPEARQRFLREAEAAGKLRHENIVTLYQYLEEGPSLYLVMEYVAGGSLRRLLKGSAANNGSALKPFEAVEIIRQTAAALDEAHAHGIVHRDVKPANILVDISRQGHLVKITDFGIARISSETLTATGLTVGTPAYMAPEQIAGSRITGKADQFSLAVVAYELLARRLPFVGDSAQSLMFRIVHEEPAPLCEGNPELPAELEAALHRALQKNPDRRFESCTALAAALKNALLPPEPTTRRMTLPAATSGRRFGIATAAFLAIAVCLILLWLWKVNKAPGGGPPAVAEATWKNPKDGLSYVRIAPGTFMMGCSPGDADCADNESPARPVTITQAFSIGQTEVTQAAYSRVTGANPAHFKAPDLPVENVSQEEAAQYCTTAGGRLPTEEEWEYAARAGVSASRYGPLADVAWYWGNSEGTTHPAGLKQPNAFGLYDVLGNVWEWTGEGYIRGGGWDNIVDDKVRVSFRTRYGKDWRSENTGFRCVIESR